MSELDLCLRLLAAAGFAVVIGLEREYAHKPAGLRTHVIVCVASALLTVTSLLIGDKLGAQGETMRVAAGVVTGVGFIGAGTILQTRHSVIGITTASTVFMAAGIGIAVGCGFYYLAGTAAALTVFVTWVLRIFDDPSRASRDDTDKPPRRLRPDRPAAPRKPEADDRD